MLATSVEKPFDSAEWLFEIKWDGYRAIAFITTARCAWFRAIRTISLSVPGAEDLPKFVKAATAILDGEVVALDDQGRASFSLMQQRTGFRPGGAAGRGQRTCPSFITHSICSISMATICGALHSRIEEEISFCR